MAEMTLDVLTAKYIELRERRKAAKKQWEEGDKQLGLLMDKIEEKMRTDLDKLGVTSVRTQHGTVFKTYKEFASIADYDALINFVKEHDAYDLFERRISKTAVRDRMEAAADGTYLNPPPPGVNFARQEVVQIRRSQT